MHPSQEQILSELGWADGSRMRRHGEASKTPLIVLHGGPAASGSSQGLAKGFAEHFFVYEPWQRLSGNTPLSVAQHISDLDALVESIGAPLRIVGESWGAMLGLAYAARHPERVQKLGLVGSGTFDKASRQEMKRLIAERIGPIGEAKIAEIMASDLEEGKKQLAKFEVIIPSYDVDCESAMDLEEDEPFDKQAHAETWDDMIRLQEAGVYPQSFSAITCPVAMFHGDYDPHPGPMIADSLRPYISKLEYFEFANAGHTPWRERQAKREFFSAIQEWLA